MKKNFTLICISLSVGLLIFGVFTFLHAQPSCDDGSGCELGCAQWSCCYRACTSCSCTCTGSPCPARIGTLVSAINRNYSQIKSSRDNLVDLIEERVEAKLRLTNIFDELRSAHQELAKCLTPVSHYIMMEQDVETDWEFIYSCSDVKESIAIELPVYDEYDNEITSCYGAESGLTDNFFCCVSRFSQAK